jgi:hypothetical protein
MKDLHIFIIIINKFNFLFFNFLAKSNFLRFHFAFHDSFLIIFLLIFFIWGLKAYFIKFCHLDLIIKKYIFPDSIFV